MSRPNFQTQKFFKITLASLTVASISFFTGYYMYSQTRSSQANDYAGSNYKDIFKDASVTKMNLSDAPIDTHSNLYVGALNELIEQDSGRSFINFTSYAPALYVAEPGTPKINFRWFNCDGKNDLTRPVSYPFLSFLYNVPNVPNMRPSPGTDGTMDIYDKETDTLWEFWNVQYWENGVRKIGQDAADSPIIGSKRPTDPVNHGWYACWGGKIENVSKSRGYFENPYGSSATGISNWGTTILYEELLNQEINHLLTIAVDKANPCDRWWPATRNDGRHLDEVAVHEGMRFRLNPAIDLDNYEYEVVNAQGEPIIQNGQPLKRKLHPMAKTVAKAAQKYGIMVRDTTRGGTSFFAENAIHFTGDPNTGNRGPYQALMGEGVAPYQLMTGFPWDEMQLIKRDHGRQSSEALPSEVWHCKSYPNPRPAPSWYTGVYNDWPTVPGFPYSSPDRLKPFYEQTQSLVNQGKILGIDPADKSRQLPGPDNLPRELPPAPTTPPITIPDEGSDYTDAPSADDAYPPHNVNSDYGNNLPAEAANQERAKLYKPGTRSAVTASSQTTPPSGEQPTTPTTTPETTTNQAPDNSQNGQSGSTAQTTTQKTKDTPYPNSLPSLASYLVREYTLQTFAAITLMTAVIGTALWRLW